MKNIKLLILFVFVGIIFSNNRVLADDTQGYNKVMSETAYRTNANGESPLGPTPKEYENSAIDLGDAFWFTGIYRASASNPDIPTRTSRNAAYRSEERPNVAMLYPGDTQSQKSQMWYNAKLNLTKPFELEYLVYMEQNIFNVNPLTGGVPDGMTFVMQNDPAGINAKGGEGVGLGVYPWYSGHYSLIYNAVTVEIDTSAQIGTTGYDREIAKLTNYTWPHMGIVSTRTPGYNGFSTNPSSSLAYDNAVKHDSPKVVQSTEEAYSFFGEWVPIKVTWTPDADLENGTLQYSVKTSKSPESVHSKKINIYDYFQNNYSGTSRPEWDKKVYWGFTGSNYQTGNATGIMLTKLPQQPIVTGERSVLNTTKGETNYRTETVADVNDIVKYKVTVKNNKTDESDLALIQTSITESLQGNEYVENSFKFTSPFTDDIPELEIINDEFKITDSVYNYKQEEYFEFTYEVKITDKSSKFTNNGKVITRYSEGILLNDTTVWVNPNKIKVTKTLDNEESKVGDIIKVTSDLDVIGGTLNLNNIRDSIPSGTKIIPDSTKIIKSSIKDDSILETIAVSDDSWSNSSFNIDLSGQSISILGGTNKTEKISLVYEVQITETIKGKKVTFLNSTFIGSNTFTDENIDKKIYQTDSNTIENRVKTDLVINFKHKDNELVSSDLIISSNSSFNKKNPVTLYYQTSESYDITDMIDEISKNLFKSNLLKEVKREGTVKGEISEEGNIVNIFYSEDVNMKVKQVYASNVDHLIYTDLDLQTTVDNTNNEYSVTIDDKISDIINNLKLKNKSEIKIDYDWYVPINSKVDYMVMVDGKELSTNVVPDKDFELLILYKGITNFEVSDLDYGRIPMTSEDVQFYDNPNTAQQATVINTDLSNEWELFISIADSIKNEDNYEEYLGGLLIEKDGAKIVIDNSGVRFSSQADQTNTLKSKIPMDIKLFQNSGNERGNYKGTILWTLRDSP